MLCSIVAVTLLVPDPGAVERAYAASLDYRVESRGAVSETQADAWSAPELAGRESVLMRPAGDEPVYLRFVEGSAPPAEAMRRLGWAATEILVEDPVRLESRLADSAFEVIGPPRPLAMNPSVVAMQALGPAGELLYFTRIPPGTSKFGLGSATRFVDRVFIVVVATRDAEATLDFYASTFGLPVTAPSPTEIGVLARAWQLPESQPFRLGVARLPQRFLIEVDEYPAAAGAPVVPPGELPAGMALVSFSVPTLEPWLDALVAPPRSIAEPPYAGRRVGVLRGLSGEHIELVETGPDQAWEASSRQR